MWRMGCCLAESVACYVLVPCTSLSGRYGMTSMKLFHRKLNRCMTDTLLTECLWIYCIAKMQYARKIVHFLIALVHGRVLSRKQSSSNSCLFVFWMHLFQNTVLLCHPWLVSQPIMLFDCQPYHMADTLMALLAASVAKFFENYRWISIIFGISRLAEFTWIAENSAKLQLNAENLHLNYGWRK